jgi:hypothetical protein
MRRREFIAGHRMPALASRSSRASASQEREIAQILAIMLDQIEGVEDRGSSGLTTGQLIKP